MKHVGQLVLAFLWLFGALLFWPLLRFVAKVPVERLSGLKWVFWLQLLGLAATFALAHYYRVAGYRDWEHALLLPYAVATVGWIAAVLALFVVGVRGRRADSVRHAGRDDGI